MKIKQYIIGMTILATLSSCTKYLDKRSDSRLSTPETLEDLYAMMSGGAINAGTLASNIGTDEYYMFDQQWEARADHDLTKDGYIWNPETNDIADWNQQYNSIFYANTVLDNLSKISIQGNETMANNLKGYALFARARSFYDLAQLYAPQYVPSTAMNDLGIPLRLSSDFNQPTQRSTVQQTYDRIIADLKEAIPLLPQQPQYKIHPGRAAAYAMLAKTYLVMGDYASAKTYADSSLAITSVLLDYNQLDVAQSFTFVRPFNDEVIFHVTNQAVNGASSAKFDTVLYQTYDSNDLRKQAFFRINPDGTIRFKGSYNGDFVLFSGIATDEVYLIRAECNARLDDAADAMEDLNTLLITRWKTGTFVPFTATTASEALSIVLTERRKELVNRGTRWADLRRLNTDSNFSTTVVRKLMGQTYTLEPNDARYTWLIPVEVISITGIGQNSR